MTTELAIPADQARKITDQIKVAIEGSWLLIMQAYEGRAWVSLGYSSWDDYCTREFGASRLRLPREERQDVVASLRESGLSLRAIETVTGVSRPTLIKDLQVVKSLPPEVPTPIDAGDFWEATEEIRADPVRVENIERHKAEVVTPKITGIDGKKYTPPTIKPDRVERRSNLPEAARTAAWDMRRAVERLVRIGDDDRFNGNKDQVAAHICGHLEYTVEVCQDLLDRLATNNKEL